MVRGVSSCSIGIAHAGGPGVGETTINTGILGVYLCEEDGVAARMAVFTVLLLWSRGVMTQFSAAVHAQKKYAEGDDCGSQGGVVLQALPCFIGLTAPVFQQAS